MEPFIRKASQDTPQVEVDYIQGEILIRGVSNPENVLRFYNPIREAVKEFEISESNDVTLNLDISYFNTSSARCIFLILKDLKDLKKINKSVAVNWYYEEDDEGMLDTGEDFQALIGLPFVFIEKNDSN